MSTLRLTTLANQAGTISVPSDTIINGSAKAWVNFNGTGTVAIRAAFNVSSITDVGLGQYTANFLVPMQDVNYSAVLSVNSGSVNMVLGTKYNTPTASTCLMITGASGGLADFDQVSLVIHR